MAITAKNEGGQGFRPIDAGTYPARCYSMVHIGTVKEIINGEEKINHIPKIKITGQIEITFFIFFF